ncbi:putative uncharacterized protein DDB_G0285119 isoform X1 [Contarinia nasturtii]|uniref:putative uncharacterized protein DDB_G0285119 isoform X1 n=1 Tax=Contarinia nasturtii TaxID=265458 RepID=UPI0012D3871D|nr:putative uncharacterized protein DDB_G0285119 isoform X1 [Contarinia nasturtii]
MEVLQKNSQNNAGNFVNVVVTSIDGNQHLMSQCIDCKCIVNTSSIAKWNHKRHSCIQKIKFIYNIPKKLNEHVAVTCLVCFKKFPIEASQLTAHRQTCKIFAQDGLYDTIRITPIGSGASWTLPENSIHMSFTNDQPSNQSTQINATVFQAVVSTQCNTEKETVTPVYTMSVSLEPTGINMPKSSAAQNVAVQNQSKNKIPRLVSNLTAINVQNLSASQNLAVESQSNNQMPRLVSNLTAINVTKLSAAQNVAVQKQSNNQIPRLVSKPTAINIQNLPASQNVAVQSQSNNQMPRVVSNLTAINVPKSPAQNVAVQSQSNNQMPRVVSNLTPINVPKSPAQNVAVESQSNNQMPRVVSNLTAINVPKSPAQNVAIQSQSNNQTPRVVSKPTAINIPNLSAAQNVESNRNQNNNVSTIMSSKPTANNLPVNQNKQTNNLRNVTITSTSQSPATKTLNTVIVDLQKLNYTPLTVKVHCKPKDKLVKCAECQFCKRLFLMELVLSHRKECTRESVKEVREIQNVPQPTEAPNIQQEIQAPAVFSNIQQNTPEVQAPEPAETNNNATSNIQQETHEISTMPIEISGMDATPTMQQEIQALPEPVQSEVLINVQTVHTPLENELNSPDPIENVDANPTPSSSSKVCFICNTSDSEPFVNMYSTFSAHSNTRIFRFVWEFLDEKSKKLTSLEQDFVCNDCLLEINEYDWANVRAQQFKKKISDKVTKTQAQFEVQINDQNDGNDDNVVNENNLEEVPMEIDTNDDASEVIDLCDDD